MPFFFVISITLVCILADFEKLADAQPSWQFAIMAFIDAGVGQYTAELQHYMESKDRPRASGFTIGYGPYDQS